MKKLWSAYIFILLFLLTSLVSQKALADNGKHLGQEKHTATQTVNIQGKSPSDPDGMSNVGADKPGGTGGINLSDQDGNNGCGNDLDFEDDNNGKCLGHRELVMVITPMPTNPVVTPTAIPTVQPTVTTAPVQTNIPTGSTLGVATLPNTGNFYLKVAVVIQILAIILFTISVLIPSKIMSRDY